MGKVRFISVTVALSTYVFAAGGCQSSYFLSSPCFLGSQLQSLPWHFTASPGFGCQIQRLQKVACLLGWAFQQSHRDLHKSKARLKPVCE